MPLSIPGVEVLDFPAYSTVDPATGTVPQILGRAITNEEGRYRIGNLPPIKVVVRGFKQGYAPAEVLADVIP